MPKLSQTVSSNIIETLSQFIGNFTANEHQRDIILITSELAKSSSIKLNSPEVEHLANKLIETKTHLSTLIFTDNTKNPLYELLTTISHGQFKTIDSHSTIEPLYLAFIERFISLDYIPLHETLMKVDPDIHEVTLILYKEKEHTNAIEIIPPLGQPFTILNTPPNVKWIQSPAFDIINIENPNVGTWQIYSDDNINNRIIADTTLKLEAPIFDALIEENSFQSLNLALKLNKHTVTALETLNHMIIKVAQIKDGRDQYAWFPADNGKNGDVIANDGLFTVPLRETLKSGEYVFQIDVDGKKFQRRLLRHIVVSKDLAWIHHEYSAQENKPLLMVVPFTQLIKPESIIMRANITDKNGQISDIEIPRHNEYAWTLPLPYAKNVEINLAGTSPGGKTTSIWLPPIALAEQKKDTHTELKPQVIKHHDTMGQADGMTPEIKHETVISKNIPITETSTIVVSIQLLITNLIFFTLCFFIYRRWKKQGNIWRQQLEGQLSYD